MPEYAYLPDSPSVGTRDDEGGITRVPTHDAFGAELTSTTNLTMVNLGRNHFVFAQAGQLKNGMTFKLLPPPPEPPAEEAAPTEEGDLPEDGE